MKTVDNSSMNLSHAAANKVAFAELPGQNSITSQANSNKAAFAELPDQKSIPSPIDSILANSLLTREGQNFVGKSAPQVKSGGSRFVEDFRSEKNVFIAEVKLLKESLTTRVRFAAVNLGKVVLLSTKKLYSDAATMLGASVGVLMASLSRAIGSFGKSAETQLSSAKLPSLPDSLSFKSFQEETLAELNSVADKCAASTHSDDSQKTARPSFTESERVTSWLSEKVAPATPFYTPMVA